MDLHELEFYVTIVEEKSITRAAEKLHVSQSALSQYLKKEEREAGTTLLKRKHNEIMTTEAGRRFYDFCRETLYQWNYTEQDIGAMTRRGRKLIMGSSAPNVSLMILEAAEKVREQYPEFEICAISGGSKQFEELILQGKMHMAFANLHERNNQITYVQTSNYPCLLMVPENHRLAKYSIDLPENREVEVPIQELGQDRFVQISEDSWFGQEESRWLKHQGFVPNTVAHVIPQDLARLMCTRLNLCAVVNGLSTLRVPGTVLVRVKNPFYCISGFAYRKNMTITPDVREFMRLFLESAKKPRSGLWVP